MMQEDSEMIVIDPSLASAKQLNLQKQIDLLEDYPYLHLDVKMETLFLILHLE